MNCFCVVFEGGQGALVLASCVCVCVRMWCWYRDIDGVLRRANATEFGLASGVFTRDIKSIYFHRL